MDQPESSRERILEAALTLLGREGLEALSFRRVAAGAGVALGLAHYHFGSKEKLLTAVIDASRERFLGRIASRQASGTPQAELRLGLTYARDLVRLMPDWYRLIAAMDAAAPRHPRVAKAAARSRRRGERDVAGLLAPIAAGFGTSVPPGLAAALLAAFDGLAQRKLADPAFDLDGAYVAIEILLLRLLAPGRRPATTAWPDPLGLTKPGRTRRGAARRAA